jgi:hypothetical protein
MNSNMPASARGRLRRQPDTNGLPRGHANLASHLTRTERLIIESGRYVVYLGALSKKLTS